MYEYMVLEAPAPSRRGWFRKSPSYAEALSDTINEAALDKWEFQRAETGLSGGASLLIFRKAVEKTRSSEDMAEPRSFNDRLLEAEGKGKSGQRREAGRDYGGPVRPRRARVLLDEAGAMTERPQHVEPDTIDLDSSAYEAPAERVTPFKPSAQRADA